MEDKASPNPSVKRKADEVASMEVSCLHEVSLNTHAVVIFMVIFGRNGIF